MDKGTVNGFRQGVFPTGVGIKSSPAAGRPTQRNPPAAASSCCTPSSSDAAGSAGPAIARAIPRSGSPRPLCPPDAGSPAASHVPGKRPSDVLPLPAAYRTTTARAPRNGPGLKIHPPLTFSFLHYRLSSSRARPPGLSPAAGGDCRAARSVSGARARPSGVSPPQGFLVRPHLSKGDDPGQGLTGWPLPPLLQQLQQSRD